MIGFAKRFKQLRLEKGLTQEELLADFNKKYHRSYRATAISFYENGKRMPEIDVLQDFAKYFNVSVSYLLGEIETRNPDSGSDRELPPKLEGDYIFIAGKNGVRKKSLFLLTNWNASKN